MPLVVVDPRVRTDGDLRVVAATNARGGLGATAHLVGLGHRRVATITGPQEQDDAVDRLAGYRTALIRAGLPVDEELVRGGAFGVDAGFRAAQVLPGLDDPPTAVFAASDDTAIGVLRAARERGVRVPADLSVVGFDDLPVAAWLDPALTTVRQPLAEMGDTAVALVQRARAGVRGARDHAGPPVLDGGPVVPPRGATPTSPASAVPGDHQGDPPGGHRAARVVRGRHGHLVRARPGLGDDRAPGSAWLPGAPGC